MDDISISNLQLYPLPRDLATAHTRPAPHSQYPRAECINLGTQYYPPDLAVVTLRSNQEIQQPFGR